MPEPLARLHRQGQAMQVVLVVVDVDGARGARMTTPHERALLERCLKLEAALLRALGERRRVTPADVAAMQELRDRGLFAREVAAQTGWGVATVNRHTVRR